MKHICFSKLTTIASDNGLSLGRHQAIIWTNAQILLIGPLETKFGEIFIENMTYDLQQAGRGVDMSWGKSSIFPVM